MVRIIMNGCNGKMGQTITGICAADPEVEIVAGIDVYTGVTNTYPVFSSIKECTVEADVVIDFSTAKAVDDLLDFCMETKTPVVLCTTGLSEAQLARIEEDSKKYRWTDDMFSRKIPEDFGSEESDSKDIIPEGENSSDIIFTIKPIKAKLLLL